MTTEQLQQFSDLVSKVKFDPSTVNITDTVSTQCSTEHLRTAGSNEEVALSVLIGSQAMVLWLNPSEAMAVAASLVAQVMRIANAKDAEQ
jgi:hypothetical protein